KNLLPALFAMFVLVAALVAPSPSNLGPIKLIGSLSAVPSVTAVDPTFGSDGGGATVIITGSNYFADPGTMVNFGATPACRVTAERLQRQLGCRPDRSESGHGQSGRRRFYHRLQRQGFGTCCARPRGVLRATLRSDRWRIRRASTFACGGHPPRQRQAI